MTTGSQLFNVTFLPWRPIDTCISNKRFMLSHHVHFSWKISQKYANLTYLLRFEGIFYNTSIQCIFTLSLFAVVKHWTDLLFYCQQKTTPRYHSHFSKLSRHIMCKCFTSWSIKSQRWSSTDKSTLINKTKNKQWWHMKDNTPQAVSHWDSVNVKLWSIPQLQRQQLGKQLIALQCLIRLWSFQTQKSMICHNNRRKEKLFMDDNLVLTVIWMCWKTGKLWIEQRNWIRVQF